MSFKNYDLFNIFKVGLGSGMVAAVDSKDPAKVLEYMMDHESQISRSPSFIPILVRVLREYKEHTDVNRQALNVISKYVTKESSAGLINTDNPVELLWKEKGVEQILINLTHIAEDHRAVLTSFVILEKAIVGNEKQTWELLKDDTIISKIPVVMTAQSKNIKVCDKAMDLLLKLLGNKGATIEVSCKLIWANLLGTMFQIIHNIICAGKDPSKYIRVLSLLEFTEKALNVNKK